MPTIVTLSEDLSRRLVTRSASADAIRDFFEARLSIEVACARAAAEQATDEDIDELRHQLSAMSTSTSAKSISDAELNFHLSVARVAANPMLLTLLTPLNRAIRPILSQRDPAAVTDGIHHLYSLVDAIETHDADAAARVTETRLLTLERHTRERGAADTLSKPGSAR